MKRACTGVEATTDDIRDVAEGLGGVFTVSDGLNVQSDVDRRRFRSAEATKGG
jgi:hypothetical protein